GSPGGAPSRGPDTGVDILGGGKRHSFRPSHRIGYPSLLRPPAATDPREFAATNAASQHHLGSSIPIFVSSIAYPYRVYIALTDILGVDSRRVRRSKTPCCRRPALNRGLARS